MRPVAGTGTTVGARCRLRGRRRGSRVVGLPEEFGDWLAAVDDFEGAADGGEEFQGGVDVHGLAQRLEQVFDGDGAVGDFGAVVVGRTDHLSAADAGAGEPEVEVAGPVIASAVLVDLGSAAELSHAHDERAFQQSALAEVGEQLGDGRVGQGRVATT